MKKNITIFLIAFLIASLFVPKLITAQTPPQKMSYQAVIRNNSNVLIASTTVGMKISILQSSLGTVAYAETQTINTNANGLVSLEIGGGTPVTGTFAGINWANGPYYIKTETDPTGGTSYSIAGTSQLLSVPYALYAKTAESIAGGISETDPIFTAWDKSTGISITESQISDLGNYIETETDPTVPTGTQTGEMQYWNGTAWVIVASGLNGQTLKYKNGVPTWSDGNINDLSIGDSYQGGIIAYILQPSDPGYISGQTHGLIAAPSDQSTGIAWYNGSNTITGVTATALGTGNANTNTIVANQGVGSYAAQLCADLVLGGYSDWYLPSKDELNELYLNKIAVGGFASAFYWSSSEYNNLYALLQWFTNGAQATASKNEPGHVRAIRSF